ncbi:p-cresol methylhydroxylase subunit [Novosphingobium sp. Rr 2-17]|uniref:c-type cytochrome n=1 Tax=Novosphingobium sp. Rr 2-17 TaxID=555793 RepID=UPI00026988CD|nr:cytochrome c [Novosphingobium sp. Rr 2-17]EIZ78200.1 p-cresol methylhydroxylase subunit [Novosphingobium sp. Rr 2-17]
MKYDLLRRVPWVDPRQTQAVWLLCTAVFLGAFGLPMTDDAHAQGNAVSARAPSTTPAAFVSDGVRIYGRWCVECHNSRGFGTVKLRERYQGSEPAVLVERKDLNPDLVRYVVRNGISFMPPFRKTEITDRELTALADYLSTDPSKRQQTH